MDSINEITRAFSELLQIDIPEKASILSLGEITLSAKIVNSASPDTTVLPEIRDLFAKLLKDAIHQLSQTGDTIFFAYKVPQVSKIPLSDFPEYLRDKIQDQSLATELFAAFCESLPKHFEFPEVVEFREYLPLGSLKNHVTDELATILEQLPWNVLGEYIFPDNTFVEVVNQAGKISFNISDNIKKKIEQNR